jgi:hypothetical protein
MLWFWVRRATRRNPMEKLQLPMELVSLVHHIELNKAGWWDVAVQQLLLAAMWISG